MHPDLRRPPSYSKWKMDGVEWHTCCTTVSKSENIHEYQVVHAKNVSRRLHKEVKTEAAWSREPAG